MLREEPHGPKRLQEADQRRRVGVAVRPPVGRRPLTSRLIHLPLPYSCWEPILISYCAAIVVCIRVSAQGVADSNRLPLLITSDQSGLQGCAGDCTSRISKGISFPALLSVAPYCVRGGIRMVWSRAG